MKRGLINVGIIGLGYWGPQLLRNFFSHKLVKVKFGCDLSRERLVQLKKIYPNITFVQNYFEILKDKTIDLVCVATPTETHFQIAKEVLKAKKNVLIEKPMASSSSECKKLINIAKKVKKTIFVDHTFIFSPSIQKIKTLLPQIGTPLYFDSERINLGLLRKDVNVIWDLAPHDFSILTYLFPNLSPLSLQVVASSHIHPSLEDLAHIMVKFKKNFIAHIHVSWISPLKIRKIIIGGSKRMIWYNDIEPIEKVKVYQKKVKIDLRKENVFHPRYISGDILIPKIENKEPLAIEVNHIVKSLLYKKKPLVGGEEGLKVVEFLEWCDKSLKEKREVKIKTQ